MKKRTLTINDIPDIPQKVSNRTIIHNALKNGKKTFMQLMNDTHIPSTGNLNSILKIMIYEKEVKKYTCKCCNSTEIYELI